MHAFIELIIGLMALLAAATLSPFGVDLNAPRGADREVHRVSDCDDKPTRASIVAARTQDC